MALTPDQKWQGGKGFKVCLFYFFVQTISRQILPGCLYLDKAARVL